MPVAVALAEKFPSVVGFDINAARVEALRAGHDSTGEVDDADLAATTLRLTCTVEDLRDCTAYIVAVPTPLTITANLI